MEKKKALLKTSLMKQMIKRILKSSRGRKKNGNISSYDTDREETNTPQKIREANESEAIRQRAEKSK
ncbi:MAG TPA: hypothetical protein VL728_12085 [Cyclobacteriaceae bacterium]|jgi:hypothetical protein|nr:hypothetical protein [Cyclobacteriaceae bacterium]